MNKFSGKLSFQYQIGSCDPFVHLHILLTYPFVIIVLKVIRIERPSLLKLPYTPSQSSKSAKFDTFISFYGKLLTFY